MGDFFISIDELKSRIGTRDCPAIFDVRRRALFDSVDTVLPTAVWRDHLASDLWRVNLPAGSEVIIHCVHGHNVSQCAAAALRARGHNARVLQGGIEGWKDAGGIVIRKDALPHRDEDVPSVWVSPKGASVDCLASAWLIRRFIDRNATFMFVEPEQAIPVAEELGGISCAVANGVYSGDGSQGTLDALLHRFAIQAPSLSCIADVVRGAEPVPEAPGLFAVAKGVSALSGDDDHASIEMGLLIFDAVYAWQSEKAVV